jgi:hypothetical protein
MFLTRDYALSYYATLNAASYIEIKVNYKLKTKHLIYLRELASQEGLGTLLLLVLFVSTGT